MRLWNLLGSSLRSARPGARFARKADNRRPWIGLVITAVLAAGGSLAGWGGLVHAQSSEQGGKPMLTTGVATSADGVSIRYESRGLGEPTLVFVHCWCCDRSYWANQLDVFAARNRVVAIDLAGHGESGLNRTDWGPKTYAEDVKAVADALGLKKMILIGHSMGGPVVAEAALLLPGRVQALVGVDIFQNIEQRPPEELVNQLLAAMQADFPAATERYIRSVMFPANADPALVDRIAKDMAAAPPVVGIESMKAMVRMDLPSVIERTKLPIYCVDSDKFPLDVEAGKRHAALFKVRVLPGVGHFLMLEKPGEFNRLLQETIAEILATQ
jgi:pimeloyl-ACP methyl ester carboxylesterase